MAITITISIQKGGNYKTTTTAVMAHYLATKQNKRVLVVDIDSQGNATNLLTGKEQEEYEGYSIYNALITKNADPYIMSGVEGIDVLPGDDLLADFTRYVYEEYKPRTGNPVSLPLYQLLEPLQDRYDYILIDTPPSLGEYTTNAIVASDYVIILAECAKWAHNAIKRFMRTVNTARELNPFIKTLGVLRTVHDNSGESGKWAKEIKKEYPELTFNTIIKRRAATSRLASIGFRNNKELGKATAYHKRAIWEILNRIGEFENDKH